MPIPHYLSQNPHYQRFVAIDDTADLVAPVLAMLAARGWTDEGGGVYKSPLTPNGRFITVELDPDDGTNLRIACVDDLARALPVVRLNLSMESVFDVWCGAGYLLIQNTTESQVIAAALLDNFPEEDDAHPNLAVVHGRYDAANTDYGGTADLWATYNEATPGYGTALNVASVGFMESASLGSTQASAGRTMLGTRKEWPVFMFGNDNTAQRLRGRLPNMVLFCIAAGATPGLRVPVSFDEADTRIFRVTAILPARGWRLGVRET